MMFDMFDTFLSIIFCDEPLMTSSQSNRDKKKAREIAASLVSKHLEAFILRPCK
jgi:hypothetical protein